jgi:hypothetical protein
LKQILEGSRSTQQCVWPRVAAIPPSYPKRPVHSGVEGSIYIHRKPLTHDVARLHDGHDIILDCDYLGSGVRGSERFERPRLVTARDQIESLGERLLT